MNKIHGGMKIEHNCSIGKRVSSFLLTSISEKEEQLENVEIALKELITLCQVTMLIYIFAVIELRRQKTLERRLFEMEERTWRTLSPTPLMAATWLMVMELPNLLHTHHPKLLWCFDGL